MKTGLLTQINGVKDKDLAIILRTMTNVVDGNLNFSDNIQGKIMRNVVFHAADFDTPIDHELGRITNDFIVIGSNGYAQFIRGKQEPTQKRIYVRCDTAGIIADILVLG